MRTARALAAVALAAAGIATTAQPCWACTCPAVIGDPITPRERAEAADVIFPGRVTEVVRDDPDTNLLEDHRVRFAVQKAYKGRVRHRITIRTASQGSACGFYFRRARRYTVFASRYEGVLSTTICSATRRGRIDADRFGLRRRHDRIGGAGRATAPGGRWTRWEM